METALIAQEHRLIPAIRTLAEIVVKRRGPDRWRQLPSALSSVAWCLLPSPGTASVGLIALLTLLVTFQQSRLLAIQNDKIEIQNMLAEAQRRASLVVEITAILERIDAEKDEGKKRQLGTCFDLRDRLCWLDAQEGQSQRTFVPSQATIGRVAALTQALRPYRYLTVEGIAPELCPQDTASPTLTRAYTALLGTVANRGPRGAADGIAPDTAKALVSPIYQPSALDDGGTFGALAARAARWIDRATGGGSNTAQLNCAPASPERGQLLVSLHAAGIDLNVIQEFGGDFTYADIPGASLAGAQLNGLRLIGARLPNANFADARLDRVDFRGADLNNARFQNATLERSNFEGARIQVATRDGDFPLWLLPRHAAGNDFSGMRLYQSGTAPNIFSRLCATFALQEGLRQDAARFGLLVETRPAGPDRQQQEAVMVHDLRLATQFLHQAEGGAALEYRSFNACPTVGR